MQVLMCTSCDPQISRAKMLSTPCVPSSYRMLGKVSRRVVHVYLYHEQPPWPSHHQA